MTTERRQYHRFNTDIEVGLIVSGQLENSGTSLLTDISEYGIRLRTLRALTPGLRVAVFLKVGELIMIRGTVIWAQSAATVTDRFRYDVGIETDAVFFQYSQETGFLPSPDLFESIVKRIEKHRGQRDAIF